ncbi:MAG: single-stranded DNA-binding protein [Patescibacteria group bacterium]
MSRSVNVAIIIGNLARDPEMRYTPQGHAVTSFAVATNRQWTSANNEEKEETEFHNVIAWNKLGELCHQLLKKGIRVYIKGRIQTRSWQGANGAKHYRTEIVADDMIVLDGRGRAGREEAVASDESPEAKLEGRQEVPEKSKEPVPAENQAEDVPADEIPF